MAIKNTSFNKIQDVFFEKLLNSIYYIFPIGMFLTACNFLFESVRNHYFDWMFVILPTAAVGIIGNFYQLYIIYQKSGLFKKSENTFIAKQVDFSMSSSNF